MKKIITFSVSGILTVVVLGGFSTEQKGHSDEQVMGTVRSYAEALKTSHVPSLVKYADDLRFPEKKPVK